jgi:hypothetical protein
MRRKSARASGDGCFIIEVGVGPLSLHFGVVSADSGLGKAKVCANLLECEAFLASLPYTGLLGRCADNHRNRRVDRCLKEVYTRF